MSHRLGRISGALLVVGAMALLVPGAAKAEPATVDVNAEVVWASADGQTLEPPEMSKIKEMFAKSGFPLSSFKRLSASKLSLAQGKAQALELPNGRKATLTLQEIKQGSAQVQVRIAELVSTVLKLGREGSVFHHAGAHNNGQLFLVLSAVKP